MDTSSFLDVCTIRSLRFIYSEGIILLAYATKTPQKIRLNYRCATNEKAYSVHSGPGSAVSIATGYWLDGPGIESRWGARFPAPVQTGPGPHPASCTMGTGF